MRPRRGEWSERASGLLLLAAAVTTLFVARGDLAAATRALDARELRVQRLETHARAAGRAGSLTATELAALLAPPGRPLVEPSR